MTQRIFELFIVYGKQDFVTTDSCNLDPEFKNLLEKLAIPFHQQTLAPEFGQPFRDFRDARRFFELYSKDQETSMLTEEFLKGKLIETGREDFPWYSPHRRQIAFLHFSVNDIPDCIE